MPLPRRPALMLALALPVAASAAETCKLGYPQVDDVTIRWQGPCKLGTAAYGRTPATPLWFFRSSFSGTAV